MKGSMSKVMKSFICRHMHMHMHTHMHTLMHMHTHTHSRFMALWTFMALWALSRITWVSGYQKG